MSRTRLLNGTPDADPEEVLEARAPVDSPAHGRYVFYWMQRAQRTRDNHALETAVATANRRGLPVLVAFVLTDGYPEANLRHYRFMAEGLCDVARGLEDRGIAFALKRGFPPEVAGKLAREAALVICDGAYLPPLRQWRRRLARSVSVPVVEVETDLVVPVEVASDKREYAARTLRPKITPRIDEYLSLPRPLTPARPAIDVPPAAAAHDVAPADPAAVCQALRLDDSVTSVSDLYPGGEREAGRRFARFLAERAHLYHERHGDPAAGVTSTISPYLHFGHISPIRLVADIREAAERDGGVREGRAEFEEQLIVRRELAYNYVHFEPSSDRYEALPAWARRTLSEHARDQRPALYTLEELEHAATTDDYWNAAMREARLTGFMQNYMRMYWGKRILEWTADPEEAFRRTLYLNNKYFLDGRDANSYAAVGWIFGLHDRPWPERAIYGKVRSMSSAGLRRKWDMDRYLDNVSRISRRS
ncbi:MAG: deoxyribodipyrimidine photo-lyase [Spirochaetaceae bacterium]